MNECQMRLPIVQLGSCQWKMHGRVLKLSILLMIIATFDCKLLDETPGHHLRNNSSLRNLQELSTQSDEHICTLWASDSCVFSRPVAADYAVSEFFWAPTSWAPCNKQCGGGVQKGVISCFASNFTKVDPSNCGDLPPLDVEQPCNVFECPTYIVHKLPWSECSKTCGTGYQTREVLCRDKFGSLVASSNCDLEESFFESQACNTEPCGTKFWTLPQWSDCDAPCGGGRQKRIPTCHSDAVSTIPICTGTQPDAERLCNSQPCQTYAWLVGPWKTCPYACEATTSRLVQCVDGYGFEQPDLKCPGNKPSNSVSCQQPHISCSDCLYDCFGNGVCQQDACSCYDGWSGQYCHTSNMCEGFLGYKEQGNVECCHLVDVDQRCCSTVFDKDGKCCESAILDSLGVCDGDAVVIDSEGKSCLTIRDEKGICCNSGVLDECHICDGDGTSCSTNMTLYLNVTGYSGSVQDEYAFQLFLLSTMDRVAMRLNIADEALSVTTTRMLSTEGEECKLNALQDSPCVQDEMLNGFTIIDMTVLPTSRETFIKRKDIMTALQPGRLSPFDFPEVLDADLLLVGNVRRAGLCGNGLCERGERCTKDGRSATTSSTSCCLQDCPYVSAMCPAPMGGPRRNMTCSGNGICLDSSGQCDCFRGYGGSDCSECMFGWITTTNGACIMLSDPKTLTKLATAYKGDSRSSAHLPSTVHARHRKGINTAGKIILLVLCGICVVLLCFLALAISKERQADLPTRQTPRVKLSIPEADGENAVGMGPLTARFPHWKSSFPGPQTDFDVIPITPMVPRATIKDVLSETEEAETSMTGNRARRRSFFGGMSSPQLELPSNPLSTDEDFTEEEQTIIAEKVKKDLKRGKSAKFVMDYLTDSDSDGGIEADEEHTHECTPDSPAVARVNNF